jgi:hypothetical protein
MELLPPNRPFPASAAQHLAPEMLHGPMDPLQCPEVPGNAVVRIVAAQHLIELVRLLGIERCRIRRIWSCKCASARRRRVFSVRTSFGSATDLATVLRRAEAAQGEREKRAGQRDANWSDWYAAYMAAEQAGTELPK